MQRVSAIILNWNNAPDTIACVRSLQAGERAPDVIVVVDNGSTDGSEARLRAELADACTVIQSGGNLGFAGGLRVGVDHSLGLNADLLWMMNNDVAVQPDTLVTLLDSVERNGPRCMYSPRIAYAGEPDRDYFRGYQVDPHSGQFRQTVEGRPPQYGAGEQDLLSVVIQGSSFLVPAELVHDYGFFSDDYFLYMEEYDYSFRLARDGVRCICVLDAVAVHRVEGSPADASVDLERVRVYYRVRNLILFWRRFFGPWTCWKFIRSYAAEQWREARHRGLRDRLSCARLRAVAHGMMGVKGKRFWPAR